MVNLKKELSTVLLIILGTAASLFILMQYNQINYKIIFSTSAAPPFELTPTIIPQVLTETAAVISPDGTWKMTMNKELKGATVSYSFLTSSNTDNHEQLIFNKTVSPSQNLTIPYNTWSPDDKYVFIKESTSMGDTYYVFNAGGDLFPDNSPYINVTDLFNLDLTDYVLTEITGWADQNLLIINTKTKQGDQGPSFWFEIPSRSFIQLSTHFG
jgi:hypothetical protein